MNYLELAEQVSLFGGALLLFLETGALFGLFVPGGDSLVLALGVLAGWGRLEPLTLWLALATGTMLGQWSGYYWGVRLGPSLFRKVPPEKLERARRFLARFGRWAVLAAPFVPVVRTLTPFLMGAGGTPWRAYFFWSAVAAWIWTGSLVALGYHATAWVLGWLGL